MPVVVPVTLTENMHDPFAARVAPASVMRLLPATAVMVPPPQLPIRPLGVDMTRPAGSMSLKATPVKATVVFGLLMVKLKVVLAPTTMLAAPNTFPMTGGAITVRDAVDVLPVPAVV